MKRNSLFNYFKKDEDSINSVQKKDNQIIETNKKQENLEINKTIKRKILLDEETDEEIEEFKNTNTKRLNLMEDNKDNFFDNNDIDKEKVDYNNDQIKIDLRKSLNSKKIINNELEKLPPFLDDKVKMDKQKRKKNHPDYDNTTLFVPESFLKTVTPAKFQYWKFKSENYNKFILFKLGKFYELFYEDALYGVEKLDLKLMGKHLHAGFPEQVLDKYILKLINLEKEIGIVEQVETDKELKIRIKNKIKIQNVEINEKILEKNEDNKLIYRIIKKEPLFENKNKNNNVFNKNDTILRRELVKVATKSSILTFNKETQEFGYLYIITKEESFSYQIIIVAIKRHSIIFINNIKAENIINKFEELVIQFNPLEIFYEKNVENYFIKDMKNFNKNIFKYFNFNSISSINIEYYLENYYDKYLELTKNNDLENPISNIGFNKIFNYLKECWIIHEFLPSMNIINYKNYNLGNDYLYISPHGIENLDIFNINDKHTLFELLNKTVTPMGKRKLKEILLKPLNNKESIIQRQEVVTYFIENDCGYWLKFFEKIKNFGDLDKKINQLSSFSGIKKGSNIIFFEKNWEFKKLEKLKTLFEEVFFIIDFFKENSKISEFLDEKLSLIKNLLYVNNKIEQNYNEIMQNFENEDVWKIKGFEEYDKIIKKLEDLDIKYDNYLKKKINKYKINFNYKEIKGKIEFEVDSMHKKKLNNKKFFYLNEVKKMYRISTNKLEKLHNEKEILLAQKINELKYFVNYIFRIFIKIKFDLINLINNFAYVEVLFSLAYVSKENNWTRTNITDKPKILKAKEFYHPLLNSDNIVKNDIGFDDNNILLITGPNMGGKSTLTRSLALLIVLNQIGCYVPCEYLEISIYDKLFTRIGINDKLKQNKSTFWIEMEDVNDLLKNGTENSFFILDELGRGTDTKNGLSICYSIIKYLQNGIKGTGILITHFFKIINLLNLNKENNYNTNKIQCYTIDFILNDDVIVFLYLLKKGIINSSFGINVAKLAKINDEIIDKAKEISSKLLE